MDERIYCPLVTDAKDLEVTATGGVELDYGVSSRCRVRLTTRLGQWALDPTLGSRLWELKTLRQALARARSIVEEALEPLVTEGAIVGVDVRQIDADPRTGMVGIEVFVTLPHAEDGEPLSVGTYRLGS